jgi:hypothetical protein
VKKNNMSFESEKVLKIFMALPLLRVVLGVDHWIWAAAHLIHI